MRADDRQSFKSGPSLTAGSRGFPSAIREIKITFTPNGKREFVPRDQVFPLFFVYCLLLLHKNK